MEKDKLLQNIWYEKYRPQSLDDLSLPDFHRKKFQEYIDNPPPPHLMFIGLPGSGKTTIAKILIKNIIKHPNDVKMVNGSGLGVDSLRIDPSNPLTGELMQFALKRPKASPCKILFIDEFDNASRDFYMRFRSEVEKLNQVSKTVIIATCNKISFDPAILQRFQDFYFNVMPMEDMLTHTCSILDKEGIQYNIETVKSVVKMLYPSMRWILQTLQKYTVDKVLHDESLETIDVNNKLIQLFKSILLSRNIEGNDFKEYVQLLRYKSHLIMPSYFLKNVNELLSPQEKVVLAKHATRISSAIHLDIALEALLVELIYGDVSS